MRCRGGALISALFITAIAVMIAVALAMQSRLLIHEGELTMNADQTYLNLQGMQQLTRLIVENYAVKWATISKTQNSTAPFVPLPTVLPKIKMHQATVWGTLDDEQGKFNINDLQNATNQARFIALLQAVVQGLSQQQSDAIAKAITAWLTNGSQDAYYVSLHPPYRSSQTTMANVSELRLVNGVTPEIYAALAPYITALPVPAASAVPPATTPAAVETPINVNSAAAPVLLTMDPQLTLQQAQSLVTCRQQFGGFTSVGAFIANCGSQAAVTTLPNATVTSHYFLAQAMTEQNGHTLILNSLLVTQLQKNNTLKVVIGWQSFV